MLKLQNIHKEYLTGDSSVTALADVSITFRKSEFVSVLGPSGCGKTTLLNIIGGLDRYTSGDLSVDGISTREYGDREWDSYRNHSVGFVFQSYNLISHQSVLSNVELALTLSGVSKEERRARAKAALEKVGLGDQLHKKPTQMSGGQMQRVAIARALVNDPEILLADEPTGALDSETSVQIMELLKEVSEDRLVIMVTHNPDLADTYSNRIIRLLDGRVVDDTNPYTVTETTTERPSVVKAENEKERKRRKKGTSMSFFTALSLSFNNLLTKKARTILTSFAGSIGIIGIALILALSTGVQNYINQVQEETLSSYPITIEAETIDLSALLVAFSGQQETETEEHALDKVYGSSAMYDLVNSLNKMQTQKNNLTDFKAFLEAERNGGETATTALAENLSAIQYIYNLNLNVLVKDTDGNVLSSDINGLMQKLMAKMMGGSIAGSAGSTTSSGSGGLGSLMSMSSQSTNNVWQEMIADGDNLVHPLLKDQYDIVSGDWPTAANEVVLVVNSKNEISDFVLYALGLKTEEELMESFDKAMAGNQLNTSELTGSWSFEEILGLTFKAVPSADFYAKIGDKLVDVREGGAPISLDNIYITKGTELRVVGIIRQNPDATTGMLSGSICYTKALTEQLITEAPNNTYLQTQIANPTIDVFTGLPFADPKAAPLTEAQKAEKWNAYLASLSGQALTEAKAAAYIAYASIPAPGEAEQVAAQMISDNMEKTQMIGFMAMSLQPEGATPEDLNKTIALLTEYYKDKDAAEMRAELRAEIAKNYPTIKAEDTKEAFADIDRATIAAMYDAKATSADAPFTNAELALFHDNEELMPAYQSSATYEENLQKLGYVDMASPKTIHIYAPTFEAKEAIADIIEYTYNKDRAEEDQIEYTDYVALLMSSITVIIDAISYVLIAFVSISLVVSSIMIGIITYISVLERTKEIGILRSIGASKKDVSRVFNAETLIVGFGAGALGIIVTLILCVIANIILHAVTGIASLNASLPIGGAVILILLSMLLTLIAGLLPSRIAAKKDPVVALRTE